MFSHQRGFHVGPPGVVCKLYKALYGLWQASRAFHKSLASCLEAAGFEKSWADPSTKQGEMQMAPKSFLQVRNSERQRPRGVHVRASLNLQLSADL